MKGSVLVMLPNTSPPRPSRSEEDQLAWLRLIRSRRVQPRNFHRLLAEYGSAQAALAALPQIAQDAGQKDYTPCPEGVALAEMRQGRKAGMRLVLQGDPDYPIALNDLEDAPPILWRLGRALPPLPTIAIVGARNASSLGLRMASRLARDLGDAGFTIVSGLARGIDTAAHEASLQSGTIAVLAGGADLCYPPENASLMSKIIDQGTIYSEQPPGQAPQTWHFPLRNRLISGMAQAVIVVEAAEKSGSLITARDALDQGREVFAVPGHPIDARAGGTNRLIREGASLIRSAEDVIDLLGRPKPATPRQQIPSVKATAASGKTAIPTSQQGQQRSKAHIRSLHQMILDRLRQSPTSEEQLAAEFSSSSGRLKGEITTMELEGHITRDSAGWLRQQ